VLTVEKLLKSVKQRAAIPISQSTFTDQDILDFANEEMDIGLVPSILSYQEEYLVRDEDYQILSNVSTYPIPYRAVGNRLRDLSFVNTDGDIRLMTRIHLDQIYAYQRDRTTENNYTYVVKGPYVELVPRVTENAFGSLRMTFYLQPNRLVLPKRVGVITNIDRNTGIITMDKFPEGMTENTKIDLVQFRAPHTIIDYDVELTQVNPVNFTVAMDPASIPASLTVGDRVCHAGETDIPNVPSDLHVVLAHRTAARCLEAQGDTEGLRNANEKLVEMEMKTGDIINSRVEGSALKVVNQQSTLRSGRFRRRW
jgi:hypothetical protein